MPATKVTDDHIANSRDLSPLGKTELISIFLNVCGERATWEEWRAFLHRYQGKGFEWTDNVN